MFAYVLLRVTSFMPVLYDLFGEALSLSLSLLYGVIFLHYVACVDGSLCR